MSASANGEKSSVKHSDPPVYTLPPVSGAPAAPILAGGGVTNGAGAAAKGEGPGVAALASWFKEAKASVSSFLPERVVATTEKTEEDKIFAEYVALFKDEGLRVIPLQEVGEGHAVYKARRKAWMEFMVLTGGKKAGFEPQQGPEETRAAYLTGLTQWYTRVIPQLKNLAKKNGTAAKPGDAIRS